MNFKDRLKVFGVGVLLGGILVAVIKSRREPEQNERPSANAYQSPEDIQRAAVPGILEAYDERGVPMQSDFIAASRLYPHADENKYERVLVLKGQESEQVLRIVETIKKPVEGRDEGEKVVNVRVMSVDQVRVELHPGSQSSKLANAIRPWGYRVLRRGDRENVYIVVLNSQEPEAVHDAIENLRTVPEVSYGSPYFLD
ncbi:MAG: hypothetical protein AAFX93_14460 [Verrucomicrobiota bacterium]